MAHDDDYDMQMNTGDELTESELQALYQWIDKIPLTRPKKNIARDFCDAVLAAEVVYAYFPKLVDLHNYPASNKIATRIYNWQTLNHKVFRKMGFAIPHREIEKIANCERGAIEKALRTIHEQLEIQKGLQAQQHDQGNYEYLQASPRKPASKRDPPPPPPEDEPAPRSAPRVGNQKPPKQQGAVSQSYDDSDERLQQKEAVISDLRESVEILQMKVQKLEHLCRIKDQNIEQLKTKIKQLESKGFETY